MSVGWKLFNLGDKLKNNKNDHIDKPKRLTVC